MRGERRNMASRQREKRTNDRRGERELNESPGKKPEEEEGSVSKEKASSNYKFSGEIKPPRPEKKKKKKKVWKAQRGDLFIASLKRAR